MRMVMQAKIVPTGEGYRIESNFEVEGERLSVESDTLTEAKRLFKEEVSKAGISEQAYSFTMGIQAPDAQ